MRRIAFSVLTAMFVLSSCTEEEHLAQEKFALQLTEMTDSEYPDNPDIGFRSANYQNSFFGIRSYFFGGNKNFSNILKNGPAKFKYT